MNDKTDYYLRSTQIPFVQTLKQEIDTLKTIQDMIKEHPNINPVDLIQSFISSFERLADRLRKTDEQRITKKVY